MTRKITPLDKYAYQAWQHSKTKHGFEEIMSVINGYPDKVTRIIFLRRAMNEDSWPLIVAYLVSKNYHICERTARRKYKKMIEYIRSHL